MKFPNYLHCHTHVCYSKPVEKESHSGFFTLAPWKVLCLGLSLKLIMIYKSLFSKAETICHSSNTWSAQMLQVSFRTGTRMICKFVSPSCDSVMSFQVHPWVELIYILKDIISNWGNLCCLNYLKILQSGVNFFKQVHRFLYLYIIVQNCRVIVKGNHG